MKFIALGPLSSTQSALGDVAEIKDAVGFAEKEDIDRINKPLGHWSRDHVRCPSVSRQSSFFRFGPVADMTFDGQIFTNALLGTFQEVTHSGQQTRMRSAGL